MEELYYIAYSRMQAGGFTLKSEMRDNQKAKDGRLIENNSKEKKY